MQRLWPWLLVGLLVVACSDPGGDDDDDDDDSDTTAPTIVSVSPASAESDVEVDAVIEVVFSEPMDPNTITTSSVSLSVGGPTISATVSYGGTTATLTPNDELSNGAAYTGLVTLEVTDAAGNALAADESWSFGTVSFQIGSPMLSEGGTFVDQNTCAGADQSPPLNWARAKDAASYAIVMTDLDNGVIHWVIWDIPPASLGLPASVQQTPTPMVPSGAKQTVSYNGTFGYQGPCPGGVAHQYQFVLYSMAVPNVPGVDTSDPRATVEAAIIANSLDSSTLTGNSAAQQN